MEWRPVHLRDNPNQSLYEVADPDIKHFDEIDKGTGGTIRDKTAAQ